MTPPQEIASRLRGKRRHVLALSLLLLACAIAVLAATLTPVPIDRGLRPAIDAFLSALHNHGLPNWFGYGDLEFAANIVLFAPLGLLIALLLPPRLAWLTLFIGPVVSIGMELTQAALLAGRFASVGDVIANSVGTVVGFGLALAVRGVEKRRDSALRQAQRPKP